jgi:hypothetical protein
VAELIYAFAEVRKLAKTSLKKFQKKYDLPVNKEELKRLLKTKSHHDFSDSEIEKVEEQLHFLSLPKSSTDIRNEIKKSRDRIEGVGRKLGFQLATDENIESIEPGESLILLAIEDDFAEADNKSFDGMTMWAIFIDHLNKLITVVFRGMLWTTTRDWKTIFRITFAEMKLHGPNSNDPIIGKVYGGPYNYLYRNQIRLSSGYQKEISEMDVILGKLQELFGTYFDYKLYVTGHSLGAALSTLFSFHAAHVNSIPNKPVINISFGSPYVGNWEFRKNFQELEKQGKLRHLRVSNEGDWVPLFPGFSLTGARPMLFKHVGLSMKLFTNEGLVVRNSFLKFSYPKPGSFRSKVYRAWENNFLCRWMSASLTYHSCDEYRSRLEAARNELESLSDLETLYRDKKITGSLFGD